MNHRPVAIGLVLCEQVIIEEGTHNVTPVNCFNLREMDELPGHATFFVLAWLAGGLEEMLAELIVERLDNSVSYLNSFGIGGPRAGFVKDMPTEVFSRIGENFIRLLRGEIVWDASTSPVF